MYVKIPNMQYIQNIQRTEGWIVIDGQESSPYPFLMLIVTYCCRTATVLVLL